MKRILCLCAVLLSPVLPAQEAVVTLRSTVTGSQEQPRVMYIVPWQQPGDPEFNYELQAGFADELFVPIDRDEFVRGLDYQAMIDAGGVTPAAIAQQQIFNDN